MWQSERDMFLPILEKMISLQKNTLKMMKILVTSV